MRGMTRDESRHAPTLEILAFLRTVLKMHATRSPPEIDLYRRSP